MFYVARCHTEEIAHHGYPSTIFFTPSTITHHSSLQSVMSGGGLRYSNYFYVHHESIQ